MSKELFKIVAVLAAIGFCSPGVARADCESDLTMLENAMATPNLTPEAKSVLDAAGVAGAAAIKKDDDATCNKAVMDGLAKAGLASPPAAAVEASTALLGDLSSFKTIAADTLKIVKSGDFAAAKTRIKDLESAWDKSAKALKAANLAKWNAVDKAIDTALKSVRAASPSAAKSAEALAALISVIDKTT